MKVAEIHYNKRLGKDFTIKELNKYFDAIVLCMGAWKSRNMRIPDEDAEGVFDGIKYLEELNEGKDIRLNGSVAVIGGGNTAFDCARTDLPDHLPPVLPLIPRGVDQDGESGH